MRPRIVALFALVLLAPACTTGGAGAPEVPEARDRSAFQRMACALPGDELETVWNGYYAGRSGNVQYVPEEPNTVGNWFSHSGPWGYLQDVPLLFHGPGHVPAVGAVSGPATLVDVAPTLAEHLRFGFDAPDGAPLRDALPVSDRAPKLVVTMVWDSVGRNVLEEHPDAWPFLARLTDESVWFEDASLGSSPSISASIHANIGTGALPRTHGRVDHWIMLDGEVRYVEETGTTDLLIPTMAELYDEAHGNEPRVGVVAFDNWHLGMIGHGEYREGGDRDLAVLRREATWGLAPVSARNFDFPEHVREVPRPTLAEIDLEDGKADGAYFGHPLPVDPEELDRGDGVLDEQLDGRPIEEFERFAELLQWSVWQSRVLDHLIEREGFGTGDVPDLLFTNFKQPDEVGHAWTMNSEEMWAAVRATDVATERLIETLNRHVGEGEWVLAILADHGSTPKVTVSGGFQIDERRLKDDIAAGFGEDTLLHLRPSQLWMDAAALADHGYTLDQVAEFLAGYTQGDNVPDPSQLDEASRDRPVFSAAFPSEILDDLPCLPDEG